VGSLANYHATVSNVEWSTESSLLREPYFEAGEPHPSRGAISNYHSFSVLATTDIPAGMELFANFGPAWSADEDPENDIYEQKITANTYTEADKVVDRLLEFFETNPVKDKDLEEDIIDLVLDKILFLTSAGRQTKQIRSLIPSSLKKLKKVKEAGGAFLYRNHDMVKSIEWLEKHGVCVDTMESKPSTIPDAGRGAFALRDFKEGDVISIVPMAMIFDDEMLKMYAINETIVKRKGKSMSQIEYDTNAFRGHQLIANYAYGHAESTVLLAPLAPMVNFINHGSDGKVNALMQWSHHEDMFTSLDYNSMDVEELQDFGTPNIVMELVATKAIAKGDEIFVDYGGDWQETWDEYKTYYDEYDKGKPWPLRGEDVTVQYKNQPYPVDLYNKKPPYPDNVVTACYAKVKDVEDGFPRITEDGEAWKDWDGPNTPQEYAGVDLYVCDLISRTVDAEKKYIYTVRLVFDDGTDEGVVVKGVPHDAIILADLPYTTDIHSRYAFRRWISLDDSVFPQKWRNYR
jgi:hypothetical protein